MTFRTTPDAEQRSDTYDPLMGLEEQITMLTSRQMEPLVGQKHHARKQSYLSLTLQSLNNLWRSTLDDLKSIQWRKVSGHVPHYLMPAIAFVASVILICWLSLDPPINRSTVCLPNGLSTYTYDGYNPWSSSETFTINMGFGSLAFGEVKLIDLVWDTVVGRGGQALMVTITYRTATNALSRLMEFQSVSRRTFELIGLQDVSVVSTANIVRDLSRNDGLRSKLTIMAVVLSAILCLVFPTLASAMTGYSPLFDTVVALPSGASVDATKLQKVWYIIHDGARLGHGFYNNFPVVDQTSLRPDYNKSYPYSRGTVEYLMYNFSSIPSLAEASRPRWMFDCSQSAPGKVAANQTVVLRKGMYFGNGSECSILWHVSQYTHKYGLRGESKNDSLFYNSATHQNISLPGPSLNISVYMAVPGGSYVGIWNLFSKHDLAWAIMPYGLSRYLTMDFQNTSRYDVGQRWLAYKSESHAELILEDDIRNFTSCRQQGPGTNSNVLYQWGFAYQPLILWLILILIWVLTTSALNADAHLNSRLVEAQRRLGLHRCIIDLAPEYEGQLSKRNVSWASDELLQELLGSGKISYRNLVSSTDNKTGKERLAQWWKCFSFKRWVRGEWFWFGLLCLWTLLLIVSAVTPTFWAVIDPISGLVLCVGIVLVLSAGKGHASRWILFVSSLALYLGLHLGLWTPLQGLAKGATESMARLGPKPSVQ